MSLDARQCVPDSAELSLYLDGVLPVERRRAVALHVERCAGCGTRLEELSQVQRSLGALPPRRVPPSLTAALRVTASRERAAQASRQTWRTYAAHHAGRLRLWRDNLLRPFAVPFAGGLASSVLLFAALAHTYPVRSVYASDSVEDIPLSASQLLPELRETSSFDFPVNEVTVDLVIDDQGRVVEYSFPSGQGMLNVPLRRAVENALLFMEFDPPTSFGQPQAGRIRMTFRRSHIDVKG